MSDSLKAQKLQTASDEMDGLTRFLWEAEAEELDFKAIELADSCELDRVEETAAKIRDLQRRAAELAPWKYGEDPGE